MSARYLKLRHISLIHLIPNSQLQWMLKMYLADEEEKKFLKAENDEQYKKDMEGQTGDGDEIFSL